MAEMKELYNLSTDVSKGELKMVFLRGLPLAFMKKHSFNSKAEVEEASSKFSGRFDDKIGGKVTFSIAVDAFVSNKDGHLSAEALRHLQYEGKEQEFEICKVTISETSEGKKVDKGDVICKGKCIVTDVSEDSEKGSLETLSVTLDGSGALFTADGKEFGDAAKVTAIKPEL